MRETWDTILPAPMEQISSKRIRGVESDFPGSRATVPVPSHTVTVAEEKVPPGEVYWLRMSRRAFAFHDST